MNAYQTAISSGTDQSACTPTALLNVIQKMFFKGEDFFDPCPSDPDFDGLRIKWHGNCYVNPPFKELPRWIQKAVFEERPTAILMPFRSAARYLHRDLLPHASALVIWCNRMCFPPHKRPIPLPMMTAGLCVDELSPAKNVDLHPVNVRYWDLEHRSEYIPALTRKLSEVYGYALGDAPVKEHKALVAGGVSFVCVETRAKDQLQEIVAHVQTSSDNIVLALMPDILFNTVYFSRVAVPWIREVVLLSPHLNVDTARERQRSMIGSVMVVFARDEYPLSTEKKESCIPGYFANYSRGAIIK